MNLSRRSFVAGLAALALSSNVALGFADEARPAFELDGPFIVGFDQDFPPYGFIDDNGEFAGFDIDMARALCELEGWEIQLEPIAWDAKDALLNSGQITCIWNAFTIEGREDAYAFTEGYIDNGQVVIVRKDSGITCLADLAGKVVLTQTDSAGYYLVTEGGEQEELGKTFAELQTLADYNTSFMMLEMGTVDAIIGDYAMACFQITGREDSLEILDEGLNSEHIGVGFALGNEDLAARVNEDLYILDEQGVVEDLCAKYADYGFSYDMWCLGKGAAADEAPADEAPADGAAGLADGSYTGTGTGIGGKFDVTVTVEGGKVTAVEVGENSETQGIGSKAIEELPAKIVEAQGIDGVDGVSGATVTSKAIFKAVTAALEEAQA